MSWLECFVFYFTLGSAWESQLWIHLLELEICWSSFVYRFIDFYSSYFLFSIVSVLLIYVSRLLLYPFLNYDILYMFWELYIVASWTTMVFISATSYSDFLCLWFCVWFYLLQILLQYVILNYSSQTCVDYCRFEWSKIVGRYIWYRSFAFRQTLAYGAKTH